MGIRWFSGAEAGDTKEAPTGSSGFSISSATVAPGGGSFSYSLGATSGGSVKSLGSLNSATLFAKTMFLMSPGTPATTNDTLSRINAGAGNIALCQWSQTLGNSSTFTIAAYNGQSGSNVQIGSPATLNYNQWYRIELHLHVSATVGVIELVIDGTVIATSSVENTGTTNASDVDFGPVSGTASGSTSTLFFDDLVVRDDAYHGASVCLGRQGVAGTPTDTSANWAITGTNIQNALSQSPSSATTKITNATASAVARTMVVNSFGAAQATADSQTARSATVIASSDTINAVKTGIVGTTSATSSDSADSIRRRVPVAATATDVAMANWTTAATYREVLWPSNPTYANLNNHEIGVLRGATGTRTHTIQDMWTMVDFTAAAGVARALVGTSASTSAFTTAPMLETRAIAGSSASTSVFTAASLLVKRAIAATSASTSAFTTAQLLVKRAVTATLASTSTFTAASLLMARKFAGSIASVSAFPAIAQMLRKRAMAATSASVSAFSNAALLVKRAVAATSASVSSMNAGLTIFVFFVASLASASTLAAAASVRRTIAATSTSVSAFPAAALKVARTFQSSLASTSAIIASLAVSGAGVALDAIVIWRNRGGF